MKNIQIRNLVRSVTKKSGEKYDEKYIKMKFYSDDKLLINKTIEIPVKVFVVRAIYFFMKIANIIHNFVG